MPVAASYGVTAPGRSDIDRTVHYVEDMPDKSAELSHLAVADQHIADGIVRILRQESLIEKMRTTGHELTVAHALLKSLQSGLLGLQQHRALIVQAIANP